MITEKIKQLKKQLRDAQLERKASIGKFLVHDNMTVSEIYDSLRKHKYFGKYNGKWFQVDEHTKLWIVKVKYFNQCDGKEFFLVVNYKGTEFIKDKMDDTFWSDLKKTNRWL